MKKTGLISFSMGETSAYMVKWLLDNKSDEYNFIVLCANTGRENNASLEFGRKCEEFFGVKVIIVEAVINEHTSVDKGNRHRVVTWETATRNQDWKHRDDTPFEQMVKMYGLANICSKFSTRELKTKPITSYMRSIGYKKGSYDTFVGLRIDEIDRGSVNAKEERIFYPLATWRPFTKKHVNFWWSMQTFRLLLKGWEGNCVDCYKKYLVKLAQIMIDDPWKFEFPEYLEKKYENYVPPGRQEYLDKNNKKVMLPIRIYRENNNVAGIRELAAKLVKPPVDDAKVVPIQTDLFDDPFAGDLDDDAGNESCEVFSECGIDN